MELNTTNYKTFNIFFWIEDTQFSLHILIIILCILILITVYERKSPQTDDLKKCYGTFCKLTPETEETHTLKIKD